MSSGRKASATEINYIFDNFKPQKLFFSFAIFINFCRAIHVAAEHKTCTLKCLMMIILISSTTDSVSNMKYKKKNRLDMD